MSRAMKDSGIPWIGEIPSHWETKRLQTQLYEINEKNSPVKTDFVLSLTNTRGVIPYTEKGDLGNKSKENYEEYKVAYPNTIVANSMNILIGSVGICNYFGCVSPVYYILKEREGRDLRFFNYILSCVPFQKHLRQYANGILEIRLRLSCNDILQRSVPTPSCKEQQAIADFLDKKCGEIDEMVSLQEKIIEELKAYKQSVITEAVTKGLNPNAPMKDSGVDWIGRIPNGWSVIRLKNSCELHGRIGWNGLRSDEFEEKSYAYLVTGQDFNSAEIDWSKCYQIRKERYEEDPFIQLENGELLITKDGSIGKVAIVSNMDKPACLNSGIFVLRQTEKTFEPKYLYWQLVSPLLKTYNDYINLGGTTIIHLYQNVFERMPLIVPSSQEEQKAIADYLDTKCSDIDSLISLKQSKIDALKEYKKSIIYEYVTGKKEVIE